MDRPRQIIPTDQLPAKPLQLDDERQAQIDQMQAMHDALRNLQKDPPRENEDQADQAVD